MTEPQPPAQSEGVWAALIDFARSMTLGQVLMLLLLIVVLAPTYMLYVTLNDPAMLGRFLSSYEEVLSDKVSCTLRIASLRGGGDQFGISTAFAAQGSEQWVVSVLMDRRPSETEIQSFCATLNLLVDHWRRPEETPSPTFPNSDEPLVLPYPSEGLP